MNVLVFDSAVEYWSGQYCFVIWLAIFCNDPSFKREPKPDLSRFEFGAPESRTESGGTVQKKTVDYCV